MPTIATVFLDGMESAPSPVNQVLLSQWSLITVGDNAGDTCYINSEMDLTAPLEISTEGQDVGIYYDSERIYPIRENIRKIVFSPKQASTLRSVNVRITPTKGEPYQVNGISSIEIGSAPRFDLESLLPGSKLLIDAGDRSDVQFWFDGQKLTRGKQEPIREILVKVT